MVAEVAFWKGLGLDRREHDGGGEWEGTRWQLCGQEMLRRCDEGWAGETSRLESKFGVGLVRRVKRAKKRREGWYRDQAAERAAVRKGAHGKEK